MTVNLKIKIYALALLVFFLSSAFAGAQETYQIPFHVQIQYFKKIFGYCLSLENPSNPKTAVICANHDDGEVIKSSFIRGGITAVEVMTPDEFLKSGSIYSVAYVALGVKTDKLRPAFIKKKTLSISGDSKIYEQGVTSVGLLMKDNKVKILFNMDRAKSEGHRFSSEFLRLTGFK